jgi:hypothetical protein
MATRLPISDDEDAQEVVRMFLEKDMVPDDATEAVTTLLEDGKSLKALRLILEARRQQD